MDRSLRRVRAYVGVMVVLAVGALAVSWWLRPPTEWSTIAVLSLLCILSSQTRVRRLYATTGMSTNSIVVGTIFSDFEICASLARRSSGTSTTPTLGSMVQNGKLAQSTAFFVIAENSVDFPTFGNPTIPICNGICGASVPGNGRMVNRRRSKK